MKTNEGVRRVAVRDVDDANGEDADDAGHRFVPTSHALLQSVSVRLPSRPKAWTGLSRSLPARSPANFASDSRASKSIARNRTLCSPAFAIPFATRNRQPAVSAAVLQTKGLKPKERKKI